MAKDLKALIEEIKIANQTQLIEAQLAANGDPTRQLRAVLRKRDTGQTKNTLLSIGLSKAFNTRPGSPRFSIQTPIRKDPPKSETKTPQTHNWSPVTTMEPGITIPYLYGTMKVKGNVITGHLGGSNVVNTGQTLSCVLAISKGPIDAFVSAKVNSIDLFTKEATVAVYSPGTDGLWGGYDFRYGWNDQASFPGVTNWVFKNIPANDLPISNGSPAVITYDMTGFDDFWVYLKFPNGLYGQPEGSSDLVAETCHITVETKTSASPTYVTVFDEDITYNSRTAIRYYIRVASPAGPTEGWYYGGFVDSSHDIRITKTTANKTIEVDKAINTVVLEYFTLGTRDPFSYPGAALFAIYEEATEVLNGTMDLSLVVRGRKVRVYTNTTTYTVVWSDNPAWVCLDVLTQPVWETNSSWDGTKYISNAFTLDREDGISVSFIDIQSFIDWAAWCDGTVVPPDYDITDTKRCTFNGIFDTTTNIWDAAQSIANNARAWLLPPSGTSKYRVVLDKPTAVTQIFTTANIVQDSLKETYTSMVDRATALQVDFFNKDSDWDQDTFNVVYTAAESVKEDSMTLFGITVPSQAWRRAMLALYYNAVTTVECEWDVGQDAINCEVGDVVGVQHELPQWGYGGRIVSATASAVTLDRPVSVLANTPYQLAVRNSNDVLTIFNIPSGANAQDPAATVLNGTFSPVPAKYDPFAFGAWFGSKQYKPFRVLEIRDNGDDTFHIVGQEYNDTIYNVDLQIPPVATPNYSSLDAFPPVTNLDLDEILIMKQDGSLLDCIDVYFTRPSSSVYAKADIYYRQVGATAWTFAGTTDTEKFRIENVYIDVTYQVTVVTINTSGRKGDVNNSPTANITTIGKSAPPSNPDGFWIVQSGSTLIFTWNHIEDSDLWGYELREGWSFAASKLIIDLQSANRYDYPAELDGTYRFWLSAIDTSGNYSLNPIALDFTVSGVDDTRNFILNSDVVQTYHASGETIYNWTWVPAGYFFTWSPS